MSFAILHTRQTKCLQRFKPTKKDLLIPNEQVVVQITSFTSNVCHSREFLLAMGVEC